MSKALKDPDFAFEVANVNPLSVNKAWRGGRRFKSQEYLDYELEWTALLKRAKKPIEGPVEISFHFHLKNWASRDVDNPLKPLLDLVVKLGYLKNDTQVVRLIATKCKHSINCVGFSIKKLKDEPHYCKGV